MSAEDLPRLRSEGRGAIARCPNCRGQLFDTDKGRGALYTCDEATPGAHFENLEGPHVNQVRCVGCGAELRPIVSYPERPTPRNITGQP